eukprot:TRINITY_DN76856_c0_g1_i1.p1 TRINITY_DN76856_c0_g1~~TRINITY_DN76856_c0_g1_i1.p1  ORF type:complete len:158 (+),score=14.26 TRINITY_DN76856_c0_g1_i1:3-476(+)
MFDFQYAGKASPCKDLAYCFLCASGKLDETSRDRYLQQYLEALTPRLVARGDDVPTIDELRDCCSLSFCDLAAWMLDWKGWPQFRARMLQLCETTLDAIDRDRRWMMEEEYFDAVFEAYPFQGQRDITKTTSADISPMARHAQRESVKQTRKKHSRR